MSFSSNVYDGDQTYEDGKQYADDKKLAVKFEIRPFKMDYLSAKEGRPIYQDMEYISIIIPGSRDVLTAPLDDAYKARFKERYDRWKADNNPEFLQGTILSELPWITKSQVAELAHNNVRTVEQLAGLSDANASQFMGNHQLRERAKKYLEAAAGEAPLTRMQAELEQRDNHIQVLERKVEELTAAFEAMNKPKTPTTPAPQGMQLKPK